MDRACDQLLAGAALARDEHGGVARRDLTDRAPHDLHAVALAEHERRLGGDPVAEAADLRRERAQLHRAVDGEGQDVAGERLGDEVVGSGAQRREHGLDVAERGHHEHRHVGPATDHRGRELEAGHPAEVDIGDHDIDGVRRHDVERAGRGARLEDLQAAARECTCEDEPCVVVVIDEQYHWHGRTKSILVVGCELRNVPHRAASCGPIRIRRSSGGLRSERRGRSPRAPGGRGRRQP